MRVLLSIFSCLLLLGCDTQLRDQPCILVFTKTNGFKHESIPDGIRALGKMADKNSWGITFTEDSTFFTTQNLESFKAVVFLNTTLDVLGPKQEQALEKYMHDGGGFVGVHSAVDTEYDWDWYGRMLAARFKSHPEIQQATLNVHKGKHPSIDHLESRWTRIDEWYYFQDTLPHYCTPLLDLDESTITSNEKTAGLHPLSWFHEFEGGRVFYTALGHTKESYREPPFLKHLEEGIFWAIGINAISRN